MTQVELKKALSSLVYDPDRLRTIPETAAYLGAGEKAVRALIKRNELKCLQIGNSYYVAQSAIHEFIERSHRAQENAHYRRELVAKGK